MIKPVSTGYKRGHIVLHYCAIVLLAFATSAMCYGAQPEKVCNAHNVFEKASILLKQREYEQARSALNQLEGCHNLSPVDTFNLGWLYGRAHDFNTALRIFKSTSSNVPNQLTHQYAVALAEFELGGFSGAVKTLTDLRSQGICDTKCANLLGVSYTKLGLYQNAYPLFAEELRKNPNDLFAYLNLVTLFADTGNFTKAADIASQAVLAFPQNPEVFVVRGSVNTLLGKLDEAHSDFATAVRLSPTKADPRFFLALSDYKQGNFATAANELKRSITAGISDSDLYYLLAECRLKIDPTNTRAALMELNRAIEINSRSVPARSLRGKLLLEEGHPKQAVADLELTLKIDPDSRSAVYNLARAYSALGKTVEANSLFKQLSTHNTDSLNELSERRLKEALADNASQ